MAWTEVEQYKTYKYKSFNKTARVVVEDYLSRNTLQNREVFCEQGNNGKTVHIQRNFYDAENLRYGIEEDGERTKFVTDGWSIFTELNAEWKPTKRLVRGYEIIASEEIEKSAERKPQQFLNQKQAENYLFYHQNEHGDTEYITGRDGKVNNAYTYDAFGNIINAEELVKNRYTYNEEQYDQISQQYYLRARSYNPLVGRFTQEDVYRGDGLNLYAYCGNNPVMYVDPSGYSEEDIPMYETAGEIRAQNNGQVVVGREGHSEVYRVIRTDELNNLHKGIIPKDITNTSATPENHVEDARKYKTTYNSTSVNMAESRRQAYKAGKRIVAIDLNKLPDSQVIVDLSPNDTVRNKRLNGNEKAVFYAGNSSEVLIQGIIHPDAVRLLSDQDVNEILNTDIQKRTIAQDRIDKNERYKKIKQNNNKCKGRKK